MTESIVASASDVLRFIPDFSDGAAGRLNRWSSDDSLKSIIQRQTSFSSLPRTSFVVRLVMLRLLNLVNVLISDHFYFLIYNVGAPIYHKMTMMIKHTKFKDSMRIVASLHVYCINYDVRLSGTSPTCPDGCHHRRVLHTYRDEI